MATMLVDVVPLTSAVGAVIEGVDLREPLDVEVVAPLRTALLDHGVVFFRDQHITPTELKAFVANFATPITEPSYAAYGGDVNADPVKEGNTRFSKAVTEWWHSDATWIEEPPTFTAFGMIRPPRVGGDTCWASVCAAYDALSAPLQEMLDQLTAVHWMKPSLDRMGVQPVRFDCIEFTHPVVRVHPETGRKALYVNESYTKEIVELGPRESTHILALLAEHVKSPDFQMRWHWAPGDLALWDNRSVQHYAVGDYEDDRLTQRVVTAGERPYGPR